jgi:hypothetical protein
MVSTSSALRWRHWPLRGLARVAVDPARHVVVEVLHGPEHPGEGLTRDEALLVRGRRRDHLVVELVRLGLPRRQDALEAGAEVGRLGGRMRLQP